MRPPGPPAETPPPPPYDWLGPALGNYIYLGGGWGPPPPPKKKKSCSGALVTLTKSTEVNETAGGEGHSLCFADQMNYWRHYFAFFFLSSIIDLDQFLTTYPIKKISYFSFSFFFQILDSIQPFTFHAAVFTFYNEVFEPRCNKFMSISREVLFRSAFKVSNIFGRSVFFQSHCFHVVQTFHVLRENGGRRLVKNGVMRLMTSLLSRVNPVTAAVPEKLFTPSSLHSVIDSRTGKI